MFRVTKGNCRHFHWLFCGVGGLAKCVLYLFLIVHLMEVRCGPTLQYVICRKASIRSEHNYTVLHILKSHYGPRNLFLWKVLRGPLLTTERMSNDDICIFLLIHAIYCLTPCSQSKHGCIRLRCSL